MFNSLLKTLGGTSSSPGGTAAADAGGVHVAGGGGGISPSSGHSTSSAAAASRSRFRGRSAPAPAPAPQQQQNQQNQQDDDNDDDVAETLLSQFPPYGANATSSVASYDDDDGDEYDENAADNGGDDATGTGGGHVSIHGGGGDASSSKGHVRAGSGIGGGMIGSDASIATASTMAPTASGAGAEDGSISQYSSSLAGSIMAGTAAAAAAAGAVGATTALFDMTAITGGSSTANTSTSASTNAATSTGRRRRQRGRINLAGEYEQETDTTTGGSTAVAAAEDYGGDDEYSELSPISPTRRAGGRVGTPKNSGGGREGTKQHEREKEGARPPGPWNDDDELGLWRRRRSQSVGGLSSSSPVAAARLPGQNDYAAPDYYYGNNDDEEDEEEENDDYYDYDYRPYIRDWSAAATAAAAAAAAASTSASTSSTTPPSMSAIIVPRHSGGGRGSPRRPRHTHVETTEKYRQQQQQLGGSSLSAPAVVLSSPSSSEDEGNDLDEELDDPLSTRRHWMPDRLCRHCYACELPFTVFRRRHHCRLCGQVFCSACSAYFVDVCDPPAPPPPPLAPSASAGSAATTTSGTADAADSNADDRVGGGEGDKTEPPQGGGDVEGSGSGHSTSPTAASSSVAAVGGGEGQQQQQQQKDQQQPAATATSALAGRRTMRTCKMCYDQVAEWGSKQEQGASGSGGAGTGSSSLLFGSRRGRATLQTQKTMLQTQQRQNQGERGDASGGLMQSHLRPDENQGLLNEKRISASAATAAEVSGDAGRGAGLKQDLPGKRITSGEGIPGNEKAKSAIEDLELKEMAKVEAEYAAALADQNQVGGSVYMQQDRSFPPTSEVMSKAAVAASASAEADGVATAQRKPEIGPKAKIAEANCRLGLAAANHLEKMGRDLLLSDAPLLLKEIGYTDSSSSIDGNSDKGTTDDDAGKKRAERTLTRWIDTLMLHASRCCATVEPDVKNRGDLLSILPYCKVKVIAGGSLSDCAYMSGVIFHKNVSHKSMAKEIVNPRIMLLSGGIEYTRSETQRIASLDTLREQEGKYMEILVNKIIKLKPDLLLVGRSVSRRAQELLLRANVVLIHHVRSTLMSRIARQTGATILSSTDHVMNQFGASVLGTCKRFRLVTFRDNESWSKGGRKGDSGSAGTSSTFKSKGVSQGEVVPHSIDDLLARKDLPNHHRQAVLAANVLGEGVLDGSDAVKQGLAKRGVAFTYTMIEGCPKHLGCTVVLRGASRPALKQVKRVFKFIVSIAYNLRLETSYLRERCAMLPPDYVMPSKLTCSSSLCIDYGDPPQGRKVRPWNGGKNDASQRSLSGKITAFDHQSILITSVWMTGRNQCCPAEVKGICYYSVQDVSLGQFLRDSCFNLALKCQNPSCKKSVLDHSLSFIHNDSLINITVEHMDKPLPPAPDGSGSAPLAEDDKAHPNKPVDKPIATWTYCTNCSKVITPLVFLSEDTWKLSFGKFLETFFYNRTAVLNAPEHGCFCQMQTSSTLYFGCGQLAARFTYEKIKPFGVFVRKVLPFEADFHRNDSLRQLELISITSSQLFAAFDKHIERISRDARQLFGSANRPEHLQAVVSELNGIGSEVDHAAKTLQEKIASVTSRFHGSGEEIEGGPAVSSTTDRSGSVANEALFRFPWQSRRYLFMLANAWNERLSAVGRTLTAMKKLSQKLPSSSSRDLSIPQTGGDFYDEVANSIKRLNQLQDMYAHYNVFDINNSMQLPRGIDANPLRRGGVARRVASNELEYQDEQDDIALDYDEDFNEDYLGGQSSDPDSEFLENIDADVLASRRRMQNLQDTSSRPRRSKSVTTQSEVEGDRSRITKSLGTRRQDDMEGQQQLEQRRRQESYYRQTSAPVHVDNADTADSQNKTTPVSAGGAVKSALTRLFNRGTKDLDPWMVNLGILNDGRPRLEPGVGGRVVPVFDDQPSTIIAYSLSSVDYDNQFKFFAKSGASADGLSSAIDGNDRAIEDIFTGGGMDVAAGSNTVQQQPGKNDKTSLRQQGISGNKATSGQRDASSTAGGGTDERKNIERQLLVRAKSHIKHTFRDFDHKGQPICKFVCTTYWATQFHAVRQAFLTTPPQQMSKDSSSGSDKAQGSSNSTPVDLESSYIRSLSAAFSWAVSGGKSGASFSRTDDGRFIVKCISRTELQMFLDCAPAYFEYLSKAFFHGLPTVLCKIVGVYQIGYHNRVTGKRTMEQVAVMQNIFHGRKISRVFDLKGSLRGRFTQQLAEKEKGMKRHGSSNDLADLDSTVDGGAAGARQVDADESGFTSGDDATEEADLLGPSVPTLLDGDFLEFTAGRPLPLNDRAKAVFHMSILNDTLFLSIINVLDYSILVGIDEERWELVVGIIDYMRQYDILKQMERVGKSLPMVVGSEAPTIIQPPLYKSRFTNAMERYFMTVPSKWTNI